MERDKATKEREEESSSPAKERRTGEDSSESAANPTRAIQQVLGNQALQEFVGTGGAEGGLELTSPGDEVEREAEAVAAEVVATGGTDTGAGMEGDEGAVSQPSDGDGGVAASPDNGTATGSESSGLEGKTGHQGTERTGSAPGDGAKPAAVHATNTTQGNGEPLPAEQRSLFESRFGSDLRGVRVHTGSRADAAARSIDAEAFTVGSDIVFRKGAYDPSSESGKRLLAHEITHVLQQGGVPAAHRKVYRAAVTENAETDQSTDQGARGELPPPAPSESAREEQGRGKRSRSGQEGTDSRAEADAERGSGGEGEGEREGGTDRAGGAGSSGSQSVGPKGPSDSSSGQPSSRPSQARSASGGARSTSKAGAGESRATGTDPSRASPEATAAAPRDTASNGAGASTPASHGRTSSGSGRTQSLESVLPVPDVPEKVDLEVPSIPTPSFEARVPVDQQVSRVRRAAAESRTALVSQLTEHHAEIDRIESEHLRTLEERKSAVDSSIANAFDQAKGDTVTFTKRKRDEVAGTAAASKSKIQGQVEAERAKARTTLESAKSATTEDASAKAGSLGAVVERYATQLENLGESHRKSLEEMGKREKKNRSPESGSTPHHQLRLSLEGDLWLEEARKIGWDIQSKLEGQAEQMRKGAPGVEARTETEAANQFAATADSAGERHEQALDARKQADKSRVEQHRAEAEETTQSVVGAVQAEYEASKQESKQHLNAALDRIKENVKRACEELRNRVTERVQRALDDLAGMVSTAFGKTPREFLRMVPALERRLGSYPDRTRRRMLDPLLTQAESAIHGSRRSMESGFESALAEQLQQPQRQSEAMKGRLGTGFAAYEGAILTVQETNKAEAGRTREQLESAVGSWKSDSPKYLDKLRTEYEARVEQARAKMQQERSSARETISKRVEKRLHGENGELQKRKSQLTKDASRLHTAMDGFGTSEEVILEVFRKASWGGIQVLKKQFAAELGHDNPEQKMGLLREWIDSETSGMFGYNQAMTAYLDHDRQEALELELEQSFGYNDQEERIRKVLESASESEIEALKDEGAIQQLKQKADEQLSRSNQELVDTLTNTEMAKKERQARSKALQLHQAFSGGWTGAGTDEATVDRILKGAKTAEERRMLREQFDSFGTGETHYDTLDAAVEGEYSGHQKQETEALAKVQRSQERLTAARIAQAVHGPGTDEAKVIGQLVNDLGVVKEGGGGTVRGAKARRRATEAGNSGGGSGGLGVPKGLQRNWVGLYLHAMEKETRPEPRSSPGHYGAPGPAPGRGSRSEPDGLEVATESGTQYKTVDELNKLQNEGGPAPRTASGESGKELLVARLKSDMGTDSPKSVERSLAMAAASGEADRSEILLYSMWGAGTDEQLLKSGLSDTQGGPMRKSRLKELDASFQQTSKDYTGESYTIPGFIGTSVPIGEKGSQLPSYTIVEEPSIEVSGKTKFEVELLLFGKPEDPSDYDWLARWAEHYAESGIAMDVLESGWVKWGFAAALAGATMGASLALAAAAESQGIDVGDAYTAEERLRRQTERFDETYRDYAVRVLGEADYARYDELTSLASTQELTPAQKSELQGYRDRLEDAPGAVLRSYERLSNIQDPSDEAAARLDDIEEEYSELIDKFERLKQLQRKQRRGDLTEQGRARLSELQEVPAISQYLRLGEVEQLSERVKRAQEHYDKVEAAVTSAVATTVEVVASIVALVVTAGGASGWTAAALTEAAIGLAGTAIKAAGKGGAYAEQLGKDMAVYAASAVTAGAMELSAARFTALLKNSDEYGKLVRNLDGLKNVDELSDAQRATLREAAESSDDVTQTLSRTDDFVNSVDEGADLSQEQLFQRLKQSYDTVDDSWAKTLDDVADRSLKTAGEETVVSATEVAVQEETWEKLDSMVDGASEVFINVATAVLGSHLEVPGAWVSRYLRTQDDEVMDALVQSIVEGTGESFIQNFRQYVENPSQSEDAFLRNFMVDALKNYAQMLPEAGTEAFMQMRRDLVATNTLDELTRLEEPSVARVLKRHTDYEREKLALLAESLAASEGLAGPDDLPVGETTKQELFESFEDLEPSEVRAWSGSGGGTREDDSREPAESEEPESAREVTVEETERDRRTGVETDGEAAGGESGETTAARERGVERLNAAAMDPDRDITEDLKGSDGAEGVGPEKSAMLQREIEQYGPFESYADFRERMQMSRNDGIGDVLGRRVVEYYGSGESERRRSGEQTTSDGPERGSEDAEESSLREQVIEQHKREALMREGLNRSIGTMEPVSIVDSEDHPFGFETKRGDASEGETYDFGAIKRCWKEARGDAQVAEADIIWRVMAGDLSALPDTKWADEARERLQGDDGTLRAAAARVARQYFGNQQRRFWRAVAADDEARAALEAVGIEFKNGEDGNAPVYVDADGEPTVSLEHRAWLSDAPTRALDAANIELMPGELNTGLAKELQEGRDTTEGPLIQELLKSFVAGGVLQELESASGSASETGQTTTESAE